VLLGVDEEWSVGTEMRQLTILSPEVQSSALFRSILINDIRRYLHMYTLPEILVEVGPILEKEGPISSQRVAL